MSPPTSRFSKLSLEDMPPMTRSKGSAASMTAPSHHAGQDSDSRLDSDSENSDIEEEVPAIVRSPTRLTYRLDGLSDKAKSTVRDVFSEPPKIALQHCRPINNGYAFQMTELVTRSVRIRAPEDGSSRLSCSCGQDDEPCEHLLWLLDQLLKQTLYDHDHDKPLTMNSEGFAEEMGDPFRKISDYHLDVLADDLHCEFVDPDTHPSEHLDSHRVIESRELLSSVYSAQAEGFRPEIFTRLTPAKKTIKRNDLDQTIFHMLLDNHQFFQYFLSQTDSSDLINDPFRKLTQRVDHVLRDLDAFRASKRPIASVLSAESPRDVRWAARHIVGCVQLIRSAIFTRDRPLEVQEATSAARTLVHILASVVLRNKDSHIGRNRVDRNLYLHLIGDRDLDFIMRELNLIPEAASGFLHDLEAIHDRIGLQGAPASYVEKFRTLLSRLRTSTSGTAMKRPVQGQGSNRGPKRMK